MEHVPVLLHESIEGLAPKRGGVIVDGTLGAGGHSSEIAKSVGKEITIIGFDLDQSALDIATKKVGEAGGKLIPVHANFKTMAKECEKLGFGKVDGVLLDLGISSMEIGQSGRGFSFMHDEPLLMTLTNPITETTLTAKDVVNSMKEDELADVIYTYGEERFSRQIAKAISMARRNEKIETSGRLADIVASAVPASYRKGRINPATKTFQALRIYINDELGSLKEGLEGAWKILKPNGRLAVITFHSSEDRIVKNFFKELPKEQKIIHTKKPIAPSRKEILENRRSRSAKLRIIEKII
ncbi:MAG: 16S rRNA (cytosine(1402)-N(4))-methyltransferase RsmH [Candidatus Pacebacteria bacterium]|nr:16S rRNA (cytosine(1402)-N(4))-methyltransferase RsmH [Candidatus Paceibacterota bacterium]